MDGHITLRVNDAWSDSIKRWRISCVRTGKSNQTGRADCSHFYYVYNTRAHRSLKNKTPFELFLRRPNFSLYNTPARNDLTSEERDFLDSEHIPLDDGIDIDCDGEDADATSTSSMDAPEMTPAHLDATPHDAEPIFTAETTSAISSAYDPMSSPHGTETSLEAAATSADEPEDFPLEIQWQSTMSEYRIGQAVYYAKHANLDGAAGVAALQKQWHKGVVVGHHTAPGNFLLYKDASSAAQGKYPCAYAH